MDIILSENQISRLIPLINESVLRKSDKEIVSDIVDYLYDNASHGFKKIRIIEFDKVDDHFEKLIDLIGYIGPYNGSQKMKLKIKLISFDQNLPSSIKKIKIVKDEEPNGIYEDPTGDKHKHVVYKKTFDGKFYDLLLNELNRSFIFDKDFDGLKFAKDYVPEKIKTNPDIVLFDRNFVDYVEKIALKDSHPSAKKALKIIEHIHKNNGYGNKSMKRDLEDYLKGRL
jgi:hypothetical protein